MSDYENLLNIREENSGGSKNNNASGNFDDFERLDDFPIHEQPEAEDRETTVISTTTSSVTAPADFGTPFDEFHELSQKNADIPSASSGLHSTDRPLVTSGAMDSASPVPVMVGSPETTEVHLTPDPEESNKIASEPFINITANVGEIPVDFGSRSTDQGQSPFFNLDSLDEKKESTTVNSGFVPSPIEPSVHHAEPSAPPEQTLFDPYPIYHESDEKIGSGGGGGGGGESEQPLLGELLNIEKSAASDFTMMEKSESVEEHHHREEHEILTSQITSSSRSNVTEKIIKEESFSSAELLSETQLPPTYQSSADDFKVEEDILVREAAEATELDEPKVTPVVSAPSAQLAANEGDVRKCVFHPRAWFNPSKLDPRVAELMYWRDVKKSAIVLGIGLALLLPLTCHSFISVVSYFLLTAVVAALLFTFFKSCLQFIQKTGDGHPFKTYLECDLTFPEEKVKNCAVIAVKHLEHTVHSLRHLLLAENFIDSVKFAVVLWCFTYIGSWFNGLTLLILAFVAFFTLPKFYETYKVQIDHYLDIGCTHMKDVMDKIKAKVPIGKKPKQQ